MAKKKEEESPDLPQEPTDCISDMLIEAFTAFYEPARADDPETEQLTTLDIMEKMENITYIHKGIIASALREHGFKITYTGAGPFWLVRKRQ